MNENRLTDPRPQPFKTSFENAIELTDEDLKAFKDALPGLYQRFAEFRRLKPEQFNTDDPVRRILEDFRPN